MFYSFIIHTIFTRKNAHDESMNITPKENKGIKRKQKNDSFSASHGSDLKTKCNCLDLSGKVAVINYAEQHPSAVASPDLER